MKSELVSVFASLLEFELGDVLPVVAALPLIAIPVLGLRPGLASLAVLSGLAALVARG